MSRITVNQLAEMMNKMQDDMSKIANAVESVNARLITLEEGKKSTTAKKPTTQKSKTSDDTISKQYDEMQKTKKPASTEPKWVLDKRCVYSVPNEFISKKARYAFKMQAEENGGTALTKEQREALVKKTHDKYITCRQFKTEKAAKEFFTKWMA